MASVVCSRRGFTSCKFDTIATGRLQFLYNTQTILGRRYTSNHEHLRKRSFRETHIPFERTPTEPKETWIPEPTHKEAMVDEGKPKGPRSTMTRSEKQSFEQLFFDTIAKNEGVTDSLVPKSTPKLPPQSRRKKEHQGFRSAKPSSDDELSAGVEEPDSMRSIMTSVNKMLESAAKQYENRKRARKGHSNRTSDSGAEAQAKVMSPIEVMKSAQTAEYERIEAKMGAAATDAELWDILKTEVFDALETLIKQGRGKAEKRQYATVADLEPDDHIESQDRRNVTIIGFNSPRLIVSAVRLLRESFPTSTLPLSIIPTVKMLGRGSYDLGISTELYNEMVIVYWTQYSDLEGINHLLEEMGNCAVAYDQQTLDILSSILSDSAKARRGTFGPISQGIWRMDFFKSATAKINNWHVYIREKLYGSSVVASRPHTFPYGAEN